MHMKTAVKSTKHYLKGRSDDGERNENIMEVVSRCTVHMYGIATMKSPCIINTRYFEKTEFKISLCVMPHF
jgi:hypothetical protein